MKNKDWKSLLFLAAGIIVVILIFFTIFLSGTKKEEKVKVGFIMSGAITESGWNEMQYAAMAKACEAYGVELIYKENVQEFTGQCKQAIEELAKEGVGMIILTSYGYSEEVSDIVSQYPEIVFYGNSSEYHASNMTSYFARMYQVRYLSGIIAGMKTESDVIGYVAAMPNNEVNRGINAFTLGVKRVNENAKVMVHWTGEWENEEAEKTAAKELISKAGADVLTYHQNREYVLQVAEEMDIFSIGYHRPYVDYSEKYLTSAVFDWYPVYKELIREYLKDKGNSQANYWIGLEKEAVYLSDFSLEVTEEIRQAVNTAKMEILSGDDVFSGVIYDTEGAIRCGENEVIGDELLLEQHNWFVEGVEFYVEKD